MLPTEKLIQQIKQVYIFQILSFRIKGNEVFIKTSTLNTKGKNINRTYKVENNIAYELLPSIGYVQMKKINLNQNTNI